MTRDDQIKEIFADVAKVRELGQPDTVKYEFISNDELRQKLNESYAEQYSSEEESLDKEIYVMMDLMKNEQNLREILTNVQSEQVIGFYEANSSDLYIVSNETELSLMDKLTLAHEYTHALQDEHFNLSSLPTNNKNSDEAMAALSLVEGDATLVMFTYALSKLNVSELENLSDEAAGYNDSELTSAPAIIRENLLFPYEAGLNFTMEFDSWSAVDVAYGDLPKSTEQIFHPEKYFNFSYRDDPKNVSIPDLRSVLGGTWKLKRNDTLGELDIKIYLNTFISNNSAAMAAAGWGGDQLQYWKNNQNKQLLIMYSTWDTTKDADEYFNAYLTFMDEKTGGNWNMTVKSTQTRQWTTTNESVYLSEQGQNALIVISTDNKAMNNVIARFPK
jgi:Zn-dependent peptidase ImmA (M78 family)